jgi:hypothetical protein
MSRIDAPGSSPLSPDPTLPDPDAPASEPRVGTAASRRTSVSESSASAPSRNELRPYDGPPAPARDGSRPPGGSRGTPLEGPAVSARELAALGGRLRVPSAPVPEGAYAALQSHLTRSLTNPLLTASDVQAAHTVLGAVPREAYRATLERMDRDGLLSTYVSRMDASARQAFLDQAASRGVLQRRAGEPPGPLGVPGRPETFVNDQQLPSALRDAVNAHATDMGRAAVVAHDDYLRRYDDAVARADSLRALRALGPPQALDLRETSLGLSWSDPNRPRYEAEWKAGLGRPQHSLVQAYASVTARARVLAGEQPAGLFVSAELSGADSGVVVKHEARASTRGPISLQTRVGIAPKAGPLGLEVTTDARGKLESQVQLEVGPVAVSHDSEGKSELSLGAKGSPFKAHASVNARTAEFAGGVAFEVSDKSGQYHGGLKLAYGMRGIVPERAGQAVREDVPGLFSRPRDLDPGRAWDDLSPERRALYERQGWTREEWAEESRR